MSVYQQGRRGRLILHATRHRFISLTLHMYYSLILKITFLRARYFFDGCVHKVKCAEYFLM